MEDVFMTVVAFFGIYQFIKVFTDYLLKRKIIITGQADKAGILEMPKDKEESSYPTLKWGLVALFAGLGLVLIYLMDKGESMDVRFGSFSYLSFGIELIAISLGFLLYFVIARSTQKK